MQIKGNSRQIPNNKTICADKKYYDILYGYLQQISEQERMNNVIVRYVPIKEINYTELGKILNLSRQTVSTKMKNLEKLGLVVRNDLKKRYELINLESDMATLVPYPTLKVLVDALSENSISTYVYLLKRYMANFEKPFQFTLSQIKGAIGISTATRSNDNIITNILFVLKKIGLIKYELITEVQKDEFGNIKTVYQINWVTNSIEDENGIL